MSSPALQQSSTDGLLIQGRGGVASNLLTPARVEVGPIEDAGLLQHGALLHAVERRELHCKMKQPRVSLVQASMRQAGRFSMSQQGHLATLAGESTRCANKLTFIQRTQYGAPIARIWLTKWPSSWSANGRWFKCKHWIRIQYGRGRRVRRQLQSCAGPPCPGQPARPQRCTRAPSTTGSDSTGSNKSPLPNWAELRACARPQ